MKKGFSLIEVIIAITILSIVMLSLIQIKENNIYLLQKVQDSAFIDAKIALVAAFEDSNTSQNEEKIYVDDLFEFKDDDIRKQFKEVVVKTDVEELDVVEIEHEQVEINLHIFEKKFTLKDGSNKNLYNFSLDIN